MCLMVNGKAGRLLHSRKQWWCVWKQNLRNVAGSVGTSHKTVCKILHEDLNLSRLSPDRVLWVLTTDQKETRICIFQEWLEADEDDNIFSQVITGDKSWLFEYNIQKNLWYRNCVGRAIYWNIYLQHGHWEGSSYTNINIVFSIRN